MADLTKDDVEEVVVKVIKDILIPSLEDMHSDIQVLKQDVGVMKEDTKILKQDVKSLKDTVEYTGRRVDRMEAKD